MRCIGKLLNIKSKLILIPFTSFVEYVVFFLVQNVVGKIDKILSNFYKTRFMFIFTIWIMFLSKNKINDN